MGLEDAFTEIDALLRRGETGEFVEPQLSTLVFGIIEQPIPAEFQDSAVALFCRIAAANKSTYFGCQFYQALLKSELPFSQIVFERAVYTEPYYNCKGDAVSGYLVAVLKNNGFFERAVTEYISDGDVKDNLPPELPKKESIKLEDRQRVKEALSYALRENRSSFMISPALRGALIFNMADITEVLEEVLRRDISELKRFSDPKTDRYDYCSTRPRVTSEIAFTIYRFTGKEAYKNIQQLLDGEEEALGDAGRGKIQDYHLRYAGVHEQITMQLNTLDCP